jgi:hypothetical protein
MKYTQDKLRFGVHTRDILANIGPEESITGM